VEIHIGDVAAYIAYMFLMSAAQPVAVRLNAVRSRSCR
jgi:hypothetical protein